MGTVKLQSSGPLYINMVIGTLAIDGCAVTFGTAVGGRSMGPASAPAHSSKANGQRGTTISFAL